MKDITRETARMICAYLGDQLGAVDNRPAFECHRFNQCFPIRDESATRSRLPECRVCKSRIRVDDPDFVSKWEDPLRIYDRQRNKTEVLRDLLAGSPAVLFCGGPSANDLPLELLNGRGIWTLAVNNAAGHSRFKPQAMLCSDSPGKFSHEIWLDSSIMKFVPSPKLSGRRARIRKRLKDGSFERHERDITDCPNVWGFQRWSWLEPTDRFFLTEGACWGNLDEGVKRTGEPKTVCTMLIALRMLYYLGARRIYLVGVDFTMRPDYGYSFPQGRDEEACRSNNAQFRIVNRWLCRMQESGVFDRFGLEIFNCFERSRLRAFPFCPFSEAIMDCKGEVTDEPNLIGWYEENPKGAKK